MPDVGKHGKTKGDLHPRHLRRIDPDPLRATPKKATRPKVRKCFGFRYEYEALVWARGTDGFSHTVGRRWDTREEWYETMEQRDQALRAHIHKHDRRFYRGHVAIERAP